MTPTNLLIPTFTQMLKTLSDWLAKAQAQMPDTADALLSAQLAPDMFPLATQVRFACVQTYEAVYRLRGENFPTSLAELRDEGRNAGERLGSIATAQTRVSEAIEWLNSLPSDALDSDGTVAHEIPNGMIFDLTAEQYARDWALPQFYFHLMTAYAILRSEGVALGKVDYVPHMFQYIRPGTMPTG